MKFEAKKKLLHPGAEVEPFLEPHNMTDEDMLYPLPRMERQFRNGLIRDLAPWYQIYESFNPTYSAPTQPSAITEICKGIIAACQTRDALPPGTLEYLEAELKVLGYLRNLIMFTH